MSGTRESAPQRPRRAFLGRRNAPGAARTILSIVAERLLDRAEGTSPGPFDLRATTVLLPGARAGRSLRRALTEGAARRGRGVLHPRIRTPRLLREEIEASELRAPTPLESRLAWIAAIHATSPRDCADLLGGAGQDPLPGDPPRDPPAATSIARLARRLDRLARELAEEGCTLERVVEVVRGAAGEDERRRFEAIARIGSRAGERLTRAGRSAPFLAAPTPLPFADPGPVIAIGLADLRPRVREVLQRLDDLEVWIHADPEDADRFDSLGTLFFSEEEGSNGERPPLAFPDDRFLIADQAIGGAELARHAIESERAAGRTPTVCVLDPEARPLVIDRLTRSGIEVHDAAGRSAALGTPGRLIAALLAWLDEGDYATLAALIRHPHLERRLDERTPTEGKPGTRESQPFLERLDRAQGKSLPVSLERLPKEHESLRRVIEAALAPVKGNARPAAAWAQPLGTLVDTLFSDSDERNPGLETLHDALALLATIPDTLAEPVPVTVPLRLLESHLANTTIPAEGDRDALDLVGWLEVELDPADSLVIVGANEGLLPGGGGTVDPLLPPRLREALGLPLDPHRAARDAWIVETLLLSGRPTTWIAARRTSEGESRHPTRFWLEEPTTRAVHVAEFYSEENHSPPVSSLLPPAEAEPTLALPRPMPHPTPIVSATVTGLGRYLECPYTYYLEHVLRAREVHDHHDELDPLAFGNRLHLVLEEFGENEATATLTDPGAITEALEGILRRQMRRAHGSEPAAVLRIQEELMRERLAPFASWQAQQVEDGWRIIAVEKKIPHETPNFSMKGLEFTVRATIDRIDAHEDGKRFRIIDYKTGERGDSPESVHRKGSKNQKEWKSLQLPIYRHLADSLGVVGQVEVGFITLPRDLGAPVYQPALWTEDEFATAIARAREVARKIHNEEFWPPKKLGAPWADHFRGETEIDSFARLVEVGEQESALEAESRERERS